MSLSDIDNAIASQQRKIASIEANLRSAQSNCNFGAGDAQVVARLSADLASARLAAVRLDQHRREQTPRDAQTDGVNRGSVFYGGQG